MEKNFVRTILLSLLVTLVVGACATSRPSVSLSQPVWTGHGDTIVVRFGNDGDNGPGDAKPDTVHVGTDVYVLYGKSVSTDSLFRRNNRTASAPAGKTCISDTIEVNYEIVFY